MPLCCLTVELALAAREQAWAMGDNEAPGPNFRLESIVAQARASARWGPARPAFRADLEEEARAIELEGAFPECGDDRTDPAPPSDPAYVVGYEAFRILHVAGAPTGAIECLGGAFSEGFPAYVRSRSTILGDRLEAILALRARRAVRA